MVATYFPGRGTLFEQTYLEGKAEGTAQSILRVLQKRGVPLTPDDRERITSCTDLDTLTRWFDRSLTATGAQEVFSEE
ncbi:hypothetical protein [Streptomyces djakartensis]|uniref:hypothetical protein n=1 Tax=Streptomyces djakartensis TaxID=68193 RepID=UPI0034DFB929